ncbi:MAG: hypothetical protein GY716_08400 [bacterium]|nr:hypothetical protein [bacterium]
MSTRDKMQSRRDPRFAIPSGYARIEIPARGLGEPRFEAEVTDFSTAGLGFKLDRSIPPPSTGTTLNGVRVHFGDCRLAGAVTVTHVKDDGGSALTIGALFYPDTEAGDHQMMGLIAGLAARP